MKKILNFFGTYLRLLYDPNFYRDVAFRETGYGIKRIGILLFFLLLPGYGIFMKQIHGFYANEWKNDIQKFPILFIQNHQVFKNSQTTATNKILEDLSVTWLDKNRMPSAKETTPSEKYFLASSALMVRLPEIDILGMPNTQTPKFLPLYFWYGVKTPFIDGKDIASHLNFKSLVISLAFICLLSFGIMFLYLFTFIRSFGFLARRMVSLFMSESLEYQVACRLLSICGIIPLSIFVISSYFIPFQTDYRYVYIAIYMLNFYFGVRIVSTNSLVRWLTPSSK
jgi:hypothetical protein